MPTALAELIAAILAVATLATAIVRPRGVNEALVAVPAAAIVVVLGIVPWHDAADTLRQLGPTIGFLAAILVFGHLCAEAGLFEYLGAIAAGAGRERPARLLGVVVALAAAVTAVLTLDATVVLLTPVVLVITRRTLSPPRPHTLACTRLANSGSLLLPVSNLTNLLAFGAFGESFGRFATLMVLPWLLVCGGEWLALRVWFRRDLIRHPAAEQPQPKPLPRYALAVLVLTVSGFVVFSALHIAVAWAAVGGCVLMLLNRRVRAATSLPRLVDEASPGFCVFVFGLAILVDAVVRHGLGDALRHVVPSGAGLAAMLGAAFLAAALANVANNLPATLVLVPLVAASPALVLATLIGVNVGPNATYGGSLATLLWRRVVPTGERPDARTFHLFGLLVVPVLLTVATVALWAAVRVVGV